MALPVPEWVGRWQGGLCRCGFEVELAAEEEDGRAHALPDAVASGCADEGHDDAVAAFGFAIGQSVVERSDTTGPAGPRKYDAGIPEGCQRGCDGWAICGEIRSHRIVFVGRKITYQ